MRGSLWFLACFLLPLSARAELFSLREHARQIDSERVALGLDTSMFFGLLGEPRYDLIAPTVGAGLRLGEVVLEAALPLAYVHVDNVYSKDLNNVAFGNPWLGVSYLPDCYCGLSRLSLGVAPDLATGSAPLDQMALSVARDTQGNWDGYLWFTDLMPIVLGASTLMRLSSLHLVWDGDVIFGLPGGGRHREFGLQNAGDVSFWLGTRAAIGARIHGVYYPTFSGDDFQASLSAYLRLRLMSNSLGVRYLVNLDGPFGDSYSKAGMWGLSIFLATTL